MFSILIPSWNNLAYLKLCVESLRKHSRFEHEIIVHVNDGSDGTLDWIKSQGLKYSHSKKNLGVCLSVNLLAAQAERNWVLYMNDDMVACPGWDTALAKAIESSSGHMAVFFGTLIERKTDNSHMISLDCGKSPEEFNEKKLLENYSMNGPGNIERQTSQPTLVQRKWWHMIGGYSVEFSPGMSSDDDLLMKFWVAGCRNFTMVGASRFYHFGCKSTGRIRRNLGGRVFVMKWGITQQEFHSRYFSKPVGTDETHFPRSSLAGRVKRIGYGLFGNYPLKDIEAWDPLPVQECLPTN